MLLVASRLGTESYSDLCFKAFNPTQLLSSTKNAAEAVVSRAQAASTKHVTGRLTSSANQLAERVVTGAEKTRKTTTSTAQQVQAGAKKVVQKATKLLGL